MVGVMNETCSKYLTRFLDDFKSEPDTATATILSLNAFQNTLRRLKPGKEDIPLLLKEMGQCIRQSRPGLIPLNHLLDFFDQDMDRQLTPGMPGKTIVKTAIMRLEERICQFERNLNGIIGQGGRLAKGTILVKSPGPYTCRILRNAKTRGKDIRVLPLDRKRKTRQMMKQLAADGITILDPGDLSQGATTLFLGPLAVTQTREAIAPFGTRKLIDDCRAKGIEVCLFTDTLHFEVAKTAVRPAAPVPCQERVSLDLADRIITEIGMVSASGQILAPPVADPRKPLAEERNQPTAPLIPELVPA